MSTCRLSRWALGLGLALALAGCAQMEDRSPRAARSTCACAPEPVVDAALLAFLSKARAAHHEADLADEQGDRGRAIQVLDRLVNGPRPGAAAGPGRSLAPEAAEVLADSLARLADLRSQGGEAEPALRDVETGLALATGPTHFRGHLLEVKGVVLERLAKTQAAGGDAARAGRTRAQAMDAFEAAIKIQDQVIDQALSGRDAGAGAGH